MGDWSERSLSGPAYRKSTVHKWKDPWGAGWGTPGCGMGDPRVWDGGPLECGM